MNGKLVLLGAGPGDPDLLTLRAVRALNTADVVLVDDLVDRRVLVHVRDGARVIDVGKRGGCKSTPQSYIDRLIVREARAGRIVVRLKGGDPFVFGRGGEEQERARAAGLPCEIVSGVTSGVAAAASAGVALTHRACAQGVAFVTGHSADAPIDWTALVASRMTLVIYMGVSRATEIAMGLRAAGLAETTPIAIVERASHRDERVVYSTLRGFVQAIDSEAIASPAIFIVGDVVSRAVAAPRQRRALRFRALQAAS
ncbi:MAG TPA: uroporphyrinogen-III C-methyltransferase [Casimicrobiaceae bacterium]|nr:uroporphyrinogen-III C-methyltransferase [Casimicrobiaceae bacterium]